jgi:hypothetical protein
MAQQRKAPSPPKNQTGEIEGRVPSSHWRQKAEEVRAKAASIVDSPVEASLQAIARMYDEMADRAARREARSHAGGRFYQ